MTDIPLKHRSFSGRDVLLEGYRDTYFESPIELKEWPENTDPLLEGEIDKIEFSPPYGYMVRCDDPSREFNLQMQSNGHLSIMRGERHLKPSFWQNTLWGIKFLSPSMKESGELNRCYFGDMNGDGVQDITYQTKDTDGGKEVYKNVVMYSSSWSKFMPNGSDTRKTYENLLEKILEYFQIKANSLREPFAPPAIVKAIGRFVGSIESLKLPEASEYLIVTDIATIFRRLAMNWKKEDPNKKMSGEQMTGDVLQVIHSLRMVMEKVARHGNAEEMTELISDIIAIITSYSNKDGEISRLKDIEMISPLMNLTEHVEDANRLKQCLTVLKFILSSEGVTRYDYNMASYLLYKLARTLSNEEFSLIYGEMRKKFNVVSSIKSSVIISGLEDIIFENAPKEYFAKAYEWLTDDDPNEMDRSLFLKYSFVFDTMFPPPYEDIKYADEELGVENARLLYDKFNIVHFKRYSKSILGHLVEMAKNPSYKKDKPLVLALVAKSDPQGMFYWGRNFEYNDETRVVVVEVGSKEEFVYYNRWVKGNYGVPNAIFITAHGTPREILLGESNFEDTMGTKDENMIKREINDIYGKDRPKLVVINACSTGGDVVDQYGNDTKENFAQAIANIYQAPTLAAEAREALPSLEIEVKDGNVNIYPYFVEMGAHLWQLWDIRFNFGGTRFEPLAKKIKPTHVRRLNRARKN